MTITELKDNMTTSIDHTLDKIIPLLEESGNQADQECIFPDKLLKVLKEIGLLSLLIPRKYGGRGGRTTDVIHLIEKVSAYCATTGTILMFHYQVVKRILQFGSVKQKEKYLPMLAKGKLGASAWTEPNSGANKHGLAANLKRSQNGYVINGQKSFCTSAGKADIYTVLVKSEETHHEMSDTFGLGNQSFVILELTDKGISFGETWNGMGMKGTSTSEIILENCYIPTDRIIGEHGDGTAIMKANRNSAIHPGIIGLGLSSKAFQVALTYAKKRNLTNHQVIRFYLSDMKTHLEATKLIVYKAGEYADNGTPKEAELYTMMSKVLVANNSIHITNMALQILGGKGYLQEYIVERLYRDARALALMGPTSELCKEIIFKESSEKESSEDKT
ncbi:acyl-CoA dehydrogenase family protein [Bacillus gobiensis]|uniref:acyl-CoA dehydrogenase family protein n=1 Tax=Bacillus gobiensis TaxID=1441095 RepID=UPI003D1D437A